MSQGSLGVAVIGVGMAGRAHAAGYRVASQMYDLDLPEIRLVAVADAHAPFAADAAQRFGYERAETSWEAIVDAPDIDVVSVVIANELHRPVVEALLAAGITRATPDPVGGRIERDAKRAVQYGWKRNTPAPTGLPSIATTGVTKVEALVMKASAAFSASARRIGRPIRPERYSVPSMTASLRWG